MKPIRPRDKGFTLIEMIAVIAITGIIAAVVAVFIKSPIDSYVSSSRRAELTDAADLALRRLGRDIRLALPNTLRVDCATDPTRCYIEFIPTSDGGRYRAAGDGSTGGNALDFTNSASTSFDVLGRVPSMAAGASGDYVVVYNLGSGYAPADAYQLNNCASSPGCNIARVNAVAGNTVTLASNRFAQETPSLPSPSNRFQVVPSTGPVTYVCPRLVAGNAMRITGYGFSSSQPVPPSGGTQSTLVGQVTCNVDYTPNVMQRNGILYIGLTLSDASGQESITSFQQIHVDNSP